MKSKGTVSIITTIINDTVKVVIAATIDHQWTTEGQMLEFPTKYPEKKRIYRLGQQNGLRRLVWQLFTDSNLQLVHSDGQQMQHSFYPPKMNYIGAAIAPDGSGGSLQLLCVRVVGVSVSWVWVRARRR